MYSLLHTSILFANKKLPTNKCFLGLRLWFLKTLFFSVVSFIQIRQQNKDIKKKKKVYFFASS